MGLVRAGEMKGDSEALLQTGRSREVEDHTLFIFKRRVKTDE